MVDQFSDGFTHANDTSNEPKSLPASETNSNPRRADNLMGSSARCAFHLQLAMPLSRGLFYCTIALADGLVDCGVRFFDNPENKDLDFLDAIFQMAGGISGFETFAAYMLLLSFILYVPPAIAGFIYMIPVFFMYIYIVAFILLMGFLLAVVAMVIAEFVKNSNEDQKLAAIIQKYQEYTDMAKKIPGLVAAALDLLHERA